MDALYNLGPYQGAWRRVRNGGGAERGRGREGEGQRGGGVSELQEKSADTELRLINVHLVMIPSTQTRLPMK